MLATITGFAGIKPRIGVVMPSPLIINEALRKQAPTVLIVDDVAAITETLSLIVQRHGYQARVAATGEDAVEQAKASAPDVLVCDIVMPGITGIEAALQIRALCPSCRIILISGAMMSAELLERASDDGNEFEVLVKPFDPNLLLDLLRDHASVAGRSS
jgi:CheY-like chemotaxis protein